MTQLAPISRHEMAVIDRLISQAEDTIAQMKRNDHFHGATTRACEEVRLAIGYLRGVRDSGMWTLSASQQDTEA